MPISAIILVGDDRHYLNELEFTLQRLGQTILRATNGIEALSLLAEIDDCSLIIAEVQMPSMDGFEMLDRFRRNPSYARIPFILIGGVNTEIHHMLRAYDLGATDFILKHVDHSILEKKAKCLIRLCEANSAIASSAKAPLRQDGSDIQRHGHTESLDKDVHQAKCLLERNRFLAGISHEIRTPLISILSFCNILRDGEITVEDRNRFVERIYRNGLHLSKIMDDIIFLARAESESLHIHKSSIRFMEEVEAVIDSFIPQIGARHVTIAKRLSGRLPRTIYTDPTRFRQVLFNLLDNALKFTEQGEIIVDICAQRSRSSTNSQQEKPSNQLVIRVADTGCGIPAEEHLQIFEPFQQGHILGVADRGAGLGLTLSRHIARSLGGDLVLEASVIGRGSIFCFSLCCDEPLPARDEQTTPKRKNCEQ